MRPLAAPRRGWATQKVGAHLIISEDQHPKPRDFSPQRSLSIFNNSRSGLARFAARIASEPAFWCMLPGLLSFSGAFSFFASRSGLCSLPWVCASPSSLASSSPFSCPFLGFSEPLWAGQKRKKTTVNFVSQNGLNRRISRGHTPFRHRFLSFLGCASIGARKTAVEREDLMDRHKSTILVAPQRSWAPRST